MLPVPTMAKRTVLIREGMMGWGERRDDKQGWRCAGASTAAVHLLRGEFEMLAEACGDGVGRADAPEALLVGGPEDGLGEPVLRLVQRGGADFEAGHGAKRGGDVGVLLFAGGTRSRS